MFDAIADVGTVLPHAVERKIPNGGGFGLQAVGARREPHLDDGSFLDGHFLKGLKDAFLVLCSDRHDSVLNRGRSPSATGEA